MYGGELAIKEMPIIDKYENIKQDIIDWGECNIQETDYNPEYSCFQPENDLKSIVELENLQNKWYVLNANSISIEKNGVENIYFT